MSKRVFKFPDGVTLDRVPAMAAEAIRKGGDAQALYWRGSTKAAYQLAESALDCITLLLTALQEGTLVCVPATTDEQKGGAR